MNKSIDRGRRLVRYATTALVTLVSVFTTGCPATSTPEPQIEAVARSAESAGPSGSAEGDGRVEQVTGSGGEDIVLEEGDRDGGAPGRRGDTAGDGRANADLESAITDLDRSLEAQTVTVRQIRVEHRYIQEELGMTGDETRRAELQRKLVLKQAEAKAAAERYAAIESELAAKKKERARHAWGVASQLEREVADLSAALDRQRVTLKQIRVEHRYLYEEIGKTRDETRRAELARQLKLKEGESAKAAEDYRRIEADLESKKAQLDAARARAGEADRLG